MAFWVTPPWSSNFSKIIEYFVQKIKLAISSEKIAMYCNDLVISSSPQVQNDVMNFCFIIETCIRLSDERLCWLKILFLLIKKEIVSYYLYWQPTVEHMVIRWKTRAKNCLIVMLRKTWGMIIKIQKYTKNRDGKQRKSDGLQKFFRDSIDDLVFCNM